MSLLIAMSISAAWGAWTGYQGMPFWTTAVGAAVIATVALFLRVDQ